MYLSSPLPPFFSSQHTSIILDDKKGKVSGGHLNSILLQQHVKHLPSSDQGRNPHTAGRAMRGGERACLPQVKVPVDGAPTLRGGGKVKTG